MYNHYGYGGSRQSDPFALLLVMGFALVIALGVWAVNLVATALSRQPRNKALWTALLVWLASVLALLLAALLTSGSAAGSGLVAVTGAGVGVSTLLLVIVARSVSVSSQQLFSQPKETLATRVLHRPWWTRPDDVA